MGLPSVNLVGLIVLQFGSNDEECLALTLLSFVFAFRIDSWATNFGETIYMVASKATGLTELQTVSSEILYYVS